MPRFFVEQLCFVCSVLQNPAMLLAAAGGMSRGSVQRLVSLNREKKKTKAVQKKEKTIESLLTLSVAIFWYKNNNEKDQHSELRLSHDQEIDRCPLEAPSGHERQWIGSQNVWK
jgi:hypothetical protein